MTTPAAAGPIDLIGTYPVSPGNGFVTDVWGWVDPTDNREYAIFGRDPSGLYIVDVTDPSLPTLAKYLTVPAFDVKTWGNYLYSCNGSGDLVSKTTTILNIADPHNPVVVGQTYGAHNIAISDAGMLYLCSPNLRALDLTVSAVNPTVWFTSSVGSHDATCRGNLVYDFAASFGGAYVREYTGPLTLQTRGQCVDATIRYYHSGDASADGKYLFVCDELAVGAFADITIFDISNPATPVKVATINDPLATVHNLFVVGDVMYVSYYRSGFKAFNVSDPAHPSLIGAYDTSPFFGDGFVGAFGVYPFLPSGNILVTDMQSGMYVFRLNTTVSVRFS
jgi:hypothetical protein